MASTQPRKQRAGWLSLGWLTDADLAKEVKDYQADLRVSTGVPVPLSNVVKDLLRRGLDSTGRRR